MTVPTRSRVTRSIVALAALIALAGCDGGPFSSPEKVGGVLGGIVAEAPEARASLVRATDVPVGNVEVYVDLSLSMRPYLADASASVLRRVLVDMSNDLGGEVSFQGFGFAPGDAAQTVTPTPVGALLSPDTYARVNNDYGALFGRFAAPTDRTPGPVRVVFTDGVESDPEGGAMFGRVVASADRYVRAGGAFAALVWRAPYAGTYYSEGAACPRGAFEMACQDRPLVAFVFAPTAGQLAALTAGLATPPDHAVRVGARDGTLEPVAEIAVAGSRRPERLLRDAREVVADGYEPVTRGLIGGTAALPSGHVPLTFRFAPDARLEPWRTLSAEDRRTFLASLRPTLRGWSVGRDGALAEFEPDVFRPSVSVDTTGALVVTVPTKKPAADGRHVAFLLSLTPYETAARLVPAGLSTPDDCSPERCGQTLNLAPLLGAILRDDYVPARAVLLTEWR